MSISVPGSVDANGSEMLPVESLVQVLLLLQNSQDVVFGNQVMNHAGKDYQLYIESTDSSHIVVMEFIDSERQVFQVEIALTPAGISGEIFPVISTRFRQLGSTQIPTDTLLEHNIFLQQVVRNFALQSGTTIHKLPGYPSDPVLDKWLIENGYISKGRKESRTYYSESDVVSAGAES